MKAHMDLSLALGFFDGVHLGHQDVVRSAVNAARAHGLKSAAVTFTRHPMYYLSSNEPAYILPQREKYRVLKELGIDYVIELDFPSVRYMTATEYISDILVKRFSPRFISAGCAHRFGVNNTGDAQLLADSQGCFNYKFLPVAERKLNGETVSSTAIRRHIQSGDVVTASQMLGRSFSITECLFYQSSASISEFFYPSNLVHLHPGSYFINLRFPDGRISPGIAEIRLDRIILPFVTNVAEIEFIRPCTLSSTSANCP